MAGFDAPVAEPMPQRTTPQHAMGVQARAWRAAATLISLILAPGLPISAVDAAGPTAAEYSRKGADSCLKCHDEASRFPVLAIFQTPHGNRGDARSPFANLQCESCHGGGGEHASRHVEDTQRAPPPAFGTHSTAPAAQQNALCMNCHDDHRRLEWPSSPHAEAALLCSDCHTVHAAHDPVIQRPTQPARCLACHAEVRAESTQLSAHPIRQGQLICSDCHQSHGNRLGDGLLIRDSLRDTCLSCHAEKRGPFLWEHAPAAEDCSLCHRPHGSNHPALLDTAPQLLCQSCHSQAGHPSTAFDASGLPGGQPSEFLLLNGCTNCHTQTHGSNHPSGLKQFR